MTKRIAFLVVVLTVVTAPTLMADHCYRCLTVPAPEVEYCVTYSQPSYQGWLQCYDDENGCYVSGDRCFNHSAQTSTPLAAEFAVASVERLDEAKTAGTATLVADTTPAKR
jgi:hypothetical protein